MQQQPNAEILENVTSETDVQNQEAQSENLENEQAQIENQSKESEEQGENKEIYGAPDSYDFKSIELPEGIQFDNALAQKFEPVAKELNLSQESANKLVNLLVEHQQSQLGNQKEIIAAFKKQELEASVIEYQKMMNSDVEMGAGDKDKQNAYIDVADKGYNAFASEGLKNTLEQLGLIYHPEVIKHFHKLGKLTGNDSIQQSTRPAGASERPADVLYGNSQK